MFKRETVMKETLIEVLYCDSCGEKIGSFTGENYIKRLHCKIVQDNVTRNCFDVCEKCANVILERFIYREREQDA